MGLPQGSVLSPILFNLFIADIYENVKFADDATIWKNGGNLRTIALELEEDLKEIVSWIHKWKNETEHTQSRILYFLQTDGRIRRHKVKDGRI